MLLDLIATPDQ